uniref:Uncharacterized protein n=1 Tax=Arundo donax TaxID=35708 RepID=A0A0A9H451_ARUDO
MVGVRKYRASEIYGWIAQLCLWMDEHKQINKMSKWINLQWPIE